MPTEKVFDPADRVLRGGRDQSLVPPADPAGRVQRRVAGVRGQPARRRRSRDVDLIGRSHPGDPTGAPNCGTVSSGHSTNTTGVFETCAAISPCSPPERSSHHDGQPRPDGRHPDPIACRTNRDCQPPADGGATSSGDSGRPRERPTSNRPPFNRVRTPPPWPGVIGRCRAPSAVARSDRVGRELPGRVTEMPARERPVPGFDKRGGRRVGMIRTPTVG